MSYTNYKNVLVLYDGTEILCKNFSINVSNSLETAYDRNTFTGGTAYATKRATTKLTFDYLISTGGDPFYAKFRDFLDNTDVFRIEDSISIQIGDNEILGPVCLESLSISGGNSSFFNASVSLIYYGSATEGLVFDEITEDIIKPYEDLIPIGHSVTSQITGIDEISEVSLEFSLQPNPIFLIGNVTDIPDFVGISQRKKTCNVKTNNIGNTVSTEGGIDVEIILSINDLQEELLQEYNITGKVDSNKINLSSEDIMSVDISITDIELVGEEVA